LPYRFDGTEIDHQVDTQTSGFQLSAAHLKTTPLDIKTLESAIMGTKPTTKNE
jgi:hypothetical protein